MKNVMILSLMIMSLKVSAYTYQVNDYEWETNDLKAQIVCSKTVLRYGDCVHTEGIYYNVTLESIKSFKIQNPHSYGPKEFKEVVIKGATRKRFSNDGIVEMLRKPRLVSKDPIQEQQRQQQQCQQQQHADGSPSSEELKPIYVKGIIDLPTIIDLITDYDPESKNCVLESVIYGTN